MTAQAAHNVVTFSASAAAFSLTNFPPISQVVSGALGNGTDTIRAKGSLLTSAAGIILYHQMRANSHRRTVWPVRCRSMLFCKRAMALSPSAGRPSRR